MIWLAKTMPPQNSESSSQTRDYVMTKSDTRALEWVGRTPAPGFLRTLLVIFIATAVGAVSAVAVVLSLVSALTAGPQSRVMLT